MRSATCIVGFGCFYHKLQILINNWDLIKSGKTAIRELPKDRLNFDIYNPTSPNPVASNKAAYIDQETTTNTAKNLKFIRQTSQTLHLYHRGRKAGTRIRLKKHQNRLTLSGHVLE